MSKPYVSIDLEKIEHNTRSITRLCAGRGIEVTGVTKGTCGHPQVAMAMLRGGVTSIGESRLENIDRLRAAGVDCPYMLLRIPPLSEVDQVVASIDISLNSELAVIAALSAAACRRGLVHDIIIMVDLGDLREGVWPDDVLPFARALLDLPGIRVRGIGTNLSCYGGVMPTTGNMQQLVDCARRIERDCALKLALVSGGNSSSLPLIAAGQMPPGINHVRIGEAILLGRETLRRSPWMDTFQDAFLLHAEIIELKQKPSVPVGDIGEDAFGRRPQFIDKGDIARAILAIGREDIDVNGIRPLDAGCTVLGASSDHLLVDVSAAPRRMKVGDGLTFSMNYSALLTAMTSPYVAKHTRPASPLRGTV